MKSIAGQVWYRTSAIPALGKWTQDDSEWEVSLGKREVSLGKWEVSLGKWEVSWATWRDHLKNNQ